MALTNVREFNLRLSEHVDGIEERHAAFTRAVALQANADLVLGTRVDTGRARSNWQVGEGEPPEGFDPNTYDAIGRGIEGGSVRDALAENARAISEMSGQSVIWLHNGVPYIGILEGLDKMLVGTVTALKTWLDGRRLT